MIKNKKKKKWTFESCKSIAEKCTSMTEFRETSNAAYQKAWREGWLETICSHIEIKSPPITFELCLTEAKKYRTKIDFAKNCNGAYRKAIRMGWLESICGHMENGHNVRRRR